MNVCETPLAVAVITIPETPFVIALDVAVKLALAEPAGTVTDEGTTRYEELLLRVTVRALEVFPLSVTVQMVELDPGMALALHCSEDRDADPLGFTVREAVCVEPL